MEYINELWLPINPIVLLVEQIVSKYIKNNNINVEDNIVVSDNVTKSNYSGTVFNATSYGFKHNINDLKSYLYFSNDKAKWQYSSIGSLIFNDGLIKIEEDGLYQIIFNIGSFRLNHNNIKKCIDITGAWTISILLELSNDNGDQYGPIRVYNYPINTIESDGILCGMLSIDTNFTISTTIKLDSGNIIRPVIGFFKELSKYFDISPTSNRPHITLENIELSVIKL